MKLAAIGLSIVALGAATTTLAQTPIAHTEGQLAKGAFTVGRGCGRYRLRQPQGR